MENILKTAVRSRRNESEPARASRSEQRQKVSGVRHIFVFCAKLQEQHYEFSTLSGKQAMKKLLMKLVMYLVCGEKGSLCWVRAI